MLAVLVSPAGNVVCPAGWADGMATSTGDLAASGDSGVACVGNIASASVGAGGARSSSSSRSSCLTSTVVCGCSGAAACWVFASVFSIGAAAAATAASKLVLQATSRSK